MLDDYVKWGITLTWRLMCSISCLYSSLSSCVCGPVSDVAGGYSSSMLDAVRRALDASKVLTIQNPEHSTLTFEEVFRLATLGGSQGETQKPHSKLELKHILRNLCSHLAF